jgi:hypothetical protein
MQARVMEQLRKWNRSKLIEALVDFEFSDLEDLKEYSEKAEIKRKELAPCSIGVLMELVQENVTALEKSAYPGDGFFADPRGIHKVWMNSVV